MLIKILPIAKPRMTRSDRWKKRPCVVRYWAFCDELRSKYKQNLPANLDLEFYLPMPNSWSKKKKEAMQWQPHQQKSDIDNLIKSVLDAICKDDAYIYELQARKYWAYNSGIYINEIERDENDICKRNGKIQRFD